MIIKKLSKTAVIVIASVVFVGVIGISAVIITKFRNTSDTDTVRDSSNTASPEQNNQVTQNPAVEAGKRLSNGKCSGTGSIKLTTSPMKPEDFSVLVPYGLMVGGHVTPIDHQYFAPKDPRSKRDAYEVRAIADGTITEISPRDRESNGEKFQEYRMVFTYTCTFFSYFDLVTSLAPDLKAAYDEAMQGQNKGWSANMNFPVKAGQVIGRIGGQTLDFAVWDTEKPLKGFIVPEHYVGEFWKIYTANPYDYFTDDVKALLIERNPRIAAPIEGKIDYDIDGKLIGNWFVEGTNGYEGSRDHMGYWKTHLSISPDHYDPSRYIVSMGDFNGTEKQYTALEDSFDPKSIGVDSKLVRVNLVGFSFVDANGAGWNGNTVIKGPKLVPSKIVQGCALFQLVETRKLKFEVFAGIGCTSTTSFTEKAKIYER